MSSSDCAEVGLSRLCIFNECDSGRIHPHNLALWPPPALQHDEATAASFLLELRANLIHFIGHIDRQALIVKGDLCRHRASLTAPLLTLCLDCGGARR
jgi:hypothetical protein